MPTCPTCAAECTAADRFCGQCGAALPRACSGCGAALAAGQRFCPGCGLKVGDPPPSAAPVPPAPPEEAAAGERRHATVVFSDLSGYTALNERLDPEEVSLIMAELREAATRVIEQHGGVVNQFVGDEIMALFGVPQAGRDDALHAVRAALELHDVADAIGARHAARTGVRLRLHTGLNTGLVIVRPCAPHQGRHGLTGDTVNTAARLLALAGPGEVIAGDDSWRQVAAHFEAERRESAAVKGKAAPVQPWRIVRELQACAPAVPLVGRDDELQQAASALRAALRGGTARLVVLRGEAGIGKSRLLQALHDEARTLGAQVFQAAVPDFGPARGQAAWRALALALLGGAADADAVQRAQSVADAVHAGTIAVALQPHLCALLDAPVPADAASTYAALDGAARERGAVDAVAALLRARAAAAPVLLTLEDLHWADASVATLLARTLAAARDLPLAWAVTTRPEAEAFDAARRGHAREVPALTLDLGPLAPTAARELAGRLAGEGTAVIERCVERAAGNPLFLEQLLRAAGDVLRDALPGTIQALVQARLDRLQPAHKAALQAASVLGQRFDPALWQALLDGAVPPLQPLVDAGLLRDDGDAVQFAHALLRDGAYESLLKSRRRELHLKAAQWFEPRDAGLHAEHLAQADSPLAAGAFLAAAHAEADRFRFDRALALVQRGEAVATDGTQRHALAMRRGQVLRELARNHEALAAFEAARDLAGDDLLLGRAWHEIADMQRHLSAVDAAWAALDAAQPVAERSGDARWRTQLHYLRGNLSFARGDVAGCAREHGLALEMATAGGDVLGQAQALSGLGDAHYAAGRMRSARDAFARCLAACERAGALRFAVTNHAMLGWCHHWCGDPQATLPELATASEMARALSHRNAMVMADESLGMMLSWMGRHDEAMAVNRRAIDGALAAGLRRFEIASRVALSMDLRAAGRLAEARDEAQRGWQVVEEVGVYAFGGPTALIEIARCTTDAAERDALVRRADAMLDAGAIAHCHLWTRAAAIHLSLNTGQPDQALRHADALERFVAAEPYLWATHQVHAARARVRHLRGERSDALRAHLAELRDEARACALGESEAALAALLDGG